MENEDTLHRCVTEFMLDTCRYTKASDCALFDCLFRCTSVSLVDDYELFCSGSFAEFYVKPMLRCVGDIDIMASFKGCLAIPAGHTPPIELPAHFEHSVTLYEVIDSHQPGYVYLKPSCILRKTVNGRYESSHLTTTTENIRAPRYLLRHTDKRETLDAINLFPKVMKMNTQNSTLHDIASLATHAHGPAIQRQIECKSAQELAHCGIPQHFIPYVYKYISFFNLDLVKCVRCPLWPPQAADWPSRLRYHGWPNQTTIDKIVNNGCDLVGAVHTRCRQDEWMNNHQWRLSFSRAEVTLLNSWTPVQQIVYHMLRFVLKREVLSKTDDSDHGLPTLTISNYHIKTLMLWECEQKPQSWWSAKSSLIKLCSSLLHKRSDWVDDKHCQNYFISNCNLLDCVDDASPRICYDLRRLADLSFLLRWFVQNYIHESAQCCPDNVSSLFLDICSSEKLKRAIHSVVDWKLSTLSEEIYDEYSMSEMMIVTDFLKFRANTTRIQILMKELQHFDLRIYNYYTGAASLQAAYTISIHSLTEDLLEVLWTLFDPLTDAFDENNSTVARRDLLCIQKAIKLATLSTVCSNALEMLYDEIAKAYLHHSFVYGQESTYCVVHVLLAALYCKSGHYQAAIDHCKQALSLNDSEQYGSRCIESKYVPHIDESVDAVSGLVLLYQHVRKNAFNSNANLKSVAFTTQFLAQYLYSKCSTTTGRRVKIYRHLSQTKQLLLSDLLLCRVIEIQLDGSTETTVAEDSSDVGDNFPSSMDTALLVTTLELVALEKLRSSRQALIRELHSERFALVNEFEVLYAYKCGAFEECMKLCRESIGTLLKAGGLSNQTYCASCPEMLCLLDGELVSTYGIIRLLRPDDLSEHLYYLQIDMLTLLLYLLARCQTSIRSDSLQETMSLIRYVHKEVFPAEYCFFDRLILKLSYRSLKLYTKTRSRMHKC